MKQIGSYTLAIVFSVIHANIFGMHNERMQKLNEELYQATYTSNYDRVQEALTSGANANAIKNDMPIIFEAKTDQIAKLFVAYGANLNAARFISRTLVHQATIPGYEPALLEYYLQYAGINVNKLTDLSETPLHIWAEFAFLTTSETLHDQLQKLDLLLRAGVDYEHRDQCFDTALKILQGYSNPQTLTPKMQQYLHSFPEASAMIQALKEALEVAIFRKKQ